MDYNIWKVQNPAGSQDWFTVQMDNPTSLVNMITSLEVSNFDFCGIGPTWGDVGIYPDNGLGTDTPNVLTPIWSSTTASMNPGASQGSAPFEVYSFTAFAAVSTTMYHGTVHWATADTCIWLGSDTDGTDTTITCARLVPNDGTDSSWTLNGFSSPGNDDTINYCIRINWTP